MSDEFILDRGFELTDEQVKNWRKMLVTMPLPPSNLALGAYALIMPVDKLTQVVDRVIELMNQELEIQRLMKEVPVKDRAIKIYNDIQEEKEKPTNIIRTRPRNPNKPVRR